jgi:VWFA-related protein
MVKVGAFASLLALAAFVAHPLAAQPPRAPQVFGVDARLVAVPVFVTDKDGRAVAGLTADDFEIEDQGRPAPVAGFLTVDAADETGRGAGAAQALAAASRRQFLLLFDLTFSTPNGVMKAQQAALDLLEKGLAAGDLVAVASVGPAGVRIPVGFTSDRFQAAHAVANLGGAEGLRLRDPLSLAYDLGIPLADISGSFGLLLQPKEKGKIDIAAVLRDQLLQVARAERDAYRQRVTAYVLELQRLAQLLDTVEGRKQVVLLSTGFDQTVLLGADRAEQAESSRAVTEGRLWEVQGDRHFGDATARSGLDTVYNALARSDVVIHSVDLGGLSTGPMASLDEMGGESRGSGRETLAQVAGRSGGRFVRESNDLAAALREVVDASRVYYVLAFEPREGGKAGQLRKLRIKVKRTGMQVSHRAGYTLPDAKATTASAPSHVMDAAEIIAKGLSGGALRMQAVAMPYRGSGGRLTLPVVLQVDGASLLAVGGDKPLRLEVYGYAFDASGRVMDAIGLTPTLDLAQLGPSVREKGVQVLTAFRVYEGPADLRFLVRDAASMRSGSLRLRADVPPAAPAALALSPPLLMDDPRARVVIPTPSQANTNLEIPFRVGEAPFTPDAAPVLRIGAPREVCVLAAGTLADAPDLRAALVRADGTSTPLAASPPRVVADSDGYRRVVTTVKPTGVEPGEYRLRLTVASASTDVHTEAPVQVVR